MLSFTIMLAANGFFIEKYLCIGCHEQQSEIAFFEFGEISHDHEHCESCAGNMCTCNTLEHLEHTTVSYFWLDQLFFSQDRTDLAAHVSLNITTLLPSYISQFDYEYFLFTHNTKIKIPPLIKTISGSADFCAMLSVFRL